jgi:transposase
MQTIIGLDLGKFNSTACTLCCGDGEVRFQSLPTTVARLRELLERERPDLVVFEACAQAGFTADLCRTLGLKYAVANTNGEAWKWKNVKRKTDRDDALKLARLAYLGELPTVELPEAAVRQRRALLNFRQLLVTQRVQLQNHVRGVLVAQGLTAPRGHRAWTEAGLDFWDDLACPSEQCTAEELWRGQLFVALALYRTLVEQLSAVEARLDAFGLADRSTQLLRSVPGVGPRTAETIAAYVDRPQRFKNSRQVSAYAGLVPRQYQSGETDRRGRITRRGPRLLRKMLVEAAWVMLRYNDWARQIVQRISKGQRTRKRQALVALARKLLVRCWAILRDGVPWREPAAAIGA